MAKNHSVDCSAATSVHIDSEPCRTGGDCFGFDFAMVLSVESTSSPKGDRYHSIFGGSHSGR